MGVVPANGLGTRLILRLRLGSTMCPGLLPRLLPSLLLSLSLCLCLCLCESLQLDLVLVKGSYHTGPRHR